MVRGVSEGLHLDPMMLTDACISDSYECDIFFFVFPSFLFIMIFAFAEKSTDFATNISVQTENIFFRILLIQTKF